MNHRNNEQNRNEPGRIPQNDPSKAMDSKKEVEQSNDEKIDQDFPGYPHYPAKEDIMDQRTDTHRVDMNVEDLPSGRNATGVNQRFVTARESQTPDRSMNPEPGIGSDDLDNDMTAIGSTTGEIGTPQNVSNEDLDQNSNDEENNEEDRPDRKQ